MRKPILIIIFAAAMQIPASTVHADRAATVGCVALGPIRAIRVNGAGVDLLESPGLITAMLPLQGKVSNTKLREGVSEDLSVAWLEPVTAEGRLYSSTFLFEVVGEQPMEAVHIGLYLEDEGRKDLATLVLDLMPGFQQIQINFDPVQLPQSRPALLFAALDPGMLVTEYNEGNNVISTSLAPCGAEPASLTLSNSFSHNARYCGSKLSWHGRAFYRADVRQESMTTEPRTRENPNPGCTELAGGYLYYTVTNLATMAVVASDMVRTDDRGFWSIEARVPESHGGQYSLRLQLGEAGLVDETLVEFTQVNCEDAPFPWTGMGVVPQIAENQAVFPDSNITLENPEFDAMTAMAGRPITLSARILSDMAWYSVPVTWEILDAKGRSISRSLVDYLSFEGETIVSHTFTPPDPELYRVVVRLGEFNFNDGLHNRSACMDLNIWQEDTGEYPNTMNQMLARWLGRLQKCVFREREALWP